MPPAGLGLALLLWCTWVSLAALLWLSGLPGVQAAGLAALLFASSGAWGLAGAGSRRVAVRAGRRELEWTFRRGGDPLLVGRRLGKALLGRDAQVTALRDANGWVVPLADAVETPSTLQQEREYVALLADDPDGDEAAGVASVPLEGLLEGDPAATERLAVSLLRRGYALVSPSSPSDAVEATFAAASDFFALPVAAKRRASEPRCGALGSNLAAGYAASGAPREYFSVRRGRDDAAWPPEAQRLSREGGRAAAAMHLVALAALRAVLRRTPGATETDATLREALSRDGGDSVLRVHHYFGSRSVPGDERLALSGHRDLGLVTVMPAGTVEALEVFDGRRWTRPEQDMGPPGQQLAVFAGQALSWLSRGECPALLHRVRRCPSDRLSMVYFLRASEATVLQRAAPRNAAIEQRTARDVEADALRRRCLQGLRDPVSRGVFRAAHLLVMALAPRWEGALNPVRP